MHSAAPALRLAALVLSASSAAWLPCSASAQTTVTGGATTTVADPGAIGGTLDFVTGDGTAGTLDLTAGGTYQGNWTINAAIARFLLNGGTLTISSLNPAGNTATGSASIVVEDGTLILGTNSFLNGFGGTLQVGSATNGGALVIRQAQWLASTTGITLDSTTAAATLTWDNLAAVTYAGTLTLAGGNTSTVATTQDTGVLTMTGAVSGTGNLRLNHTGVSAAPTIILGLSNGFTGRTILDTVNAQINTQQSIGSAGLSLNGATMTMTAVNPLTFAAAQTLEVNSDSTIRGTGGTPSALTLDGEMQGVAALTLDRIALTVNGATSNFTGNLSMRDGSSLTVANADWLADVNTVFMNADGNATTFTYSGGVAGTFDGTLDLGAGTATVSSTGQNFSLTGTVAGTGNLLVTRQAATTAEIGLGFTAGSFTGTTIVSQTAARLLTDASVGTTGLRLEGGDLTIDAALGSLTMGAARAFTVNGTSSVTGTGGASALNVDASMTGNGTLTITDIAMNVSDGATSAGYQGRVTLAAGSALNVANSDWMGRLRGLTFNAARTVTYTDNVAATYSGSIVLASNATIQTSGAAAAGLTLSGNVSGTGDLLLGAVAGSAAPFVLSLGGSFTGSTVVTDANVTINSQGSIGSAGLRLNDLANDGLTATIGTSLAFSNTQAFQVDRTVSLVGSVAGASIDAQGGLNSSAGATLNVDDVALTVGNGSASNFDGAVNLADGASLILDGANLSGARVTSVAGGDPVTFGGIGTIGAIGAAVNPFAGSVNLGDLGASPSSVLAVSGNATLASGATLRSHLLSSSGGTGVADLLSVGGTFTAGGSTANLVFDPGVFTGSLIPAAGQTDTYTIVSATGSFSGTFGAVNVVTIDPVTGLSTTRALDQDGETRFLGAGFTVDYGANAFALSILGIGGPAPLPPSGTTSTDVVVPVQVGSATVDRNANVGTVSNAQINASVDGMNALLLDPAASADAKFVATQILLNDAPAYASSVVAVSAPANPHALPETLMLGMFQSNDVAMRRMMQLRPLSAPAGGVSPGALAAQDRPRRPWERGSVSTASAQPVAVSTRKAFGSPMYGPTPDSGVRGWARGFGWTGNFSNQSWASTSYDATLGNVAAGGDVSLAEGGILGAFVGYMPGSVDVTGGLVDESMNVNGVNFGVYGSWVPDRGSWYLAGSASGAWASIDRTRTLYIPGAVRTADSSSTAWSASASGETGWNLWLGGDSYLDPYVRASFGYFNQGSYTESGAGSMNLSVDDQQAYALQPSVGTRFTHGIRSGGSVITPFVGGAFTAIVPIGDWTANATNSFTSLPLIQVYGDPDTQYGGTCEAGLEWAMPSGFTFFASFNGMFLSDVNLYGGSAGIVIPF